MTRSYPAALALLLGTIGGLIWWIDREPRPAPAFVPTPGAVSPFNQNRAVPSGASSDAIAQETSRPAGKSADGLLLIDDIAETARLLDSSDSTAAHDLEIVHQLIDFFRRTNKGVIPPGGLNEEIVDQLRGRNPRNLAIIPAELRAVNPAGQLLDRWGTPYFFHPVSSSLLEVRSAGPDRRFWTADDLE